MATVSYIDATVTGSDTASRMGRAAATVIRYQLSDKTALVREFGSLRRLQTRLDAAVTAGSGADLQPLDAERVLQLALGLDAIRQIAKPEAEGPSAKLNRDYPTLWTSPGAQWGSVDVRSFPISIVPGYASYDLAALVLRAFRSGVEAASAVFVINDTP